MELAKRAHVLKLNDGEVGQLAHVDPISWPIHVRSAASNSGLKLADYLRDLIAARKADLSANRDDFLTRLLRLQNTGGDSLDDDGVRRNISGIIVGAVETTSAAVAQAIDVLFGRPRESDGGAMGSVHRRAERRPAPHNGPDVDTITGAEVGPAGRGACLLGRFPLPSIVDAGG